MIKSADEFVRLRTSELPAEYGQATHETADEAVWREVILRFPEMMEWVAHNKTISESIIRVLYDSGNERTRHALARKRRTPVDLLTHLANDESESTRLAVAMNPSVPVAILERLVNDPWIEVRRIAERRLSSLRPGSN
jgi:hypothetical protein